MSLSCPYCKSKDLSRKGYYFVQFLRSERRRYICKDCGRTFSKQTFKPTYRQQKPYLNDQIFELSMSGVTQRRSARLLKCSKNTIERKLLWLSKYKKDEEKIQ